MDRVIITRRFVNLCTMQVCAKSDVTDEEMLRVCNEQHPSGVEHGWSEVLRVATEANPFKTFNKLPVPCADCPGRTHFFVLC